MDIIKIGYNSFKIALNASEAREYDFTSDEPCDDEKLKSSLKLLLERVKNKNKIDIEADKISTEIYISKDGGCEIFISKSGSYKNGRRVRKAESASIYCFLTIDELLRACSRAHSINLKSPSEVYHNKESGEYYLIFSELYPKELRCAFLMEHGSKIISYIK